VFWLQTDEEMQHTDVAVHATPSGMHAAASFVLESCGGVPLSGTGL
jgi:hypothetical protein